MLRHPGRELRSPRGWLILTFLFSHYLAAGEEKAAAMALFTLKKMAAGGMYDQLGGGFHRYSVDGNWFVPHFEKMLYDQAQLADSYLDGFLLTKDEAYGRIARETLAYLLRDMHDPAGGFYSAEDADSDDPYAPGHHGEGAFYLWTRDDIVKKLGRQPANIFITCYGVKDDGNVAEDPMHEFSGRNILFRARSDEEVAAELQLTPEQVGKSLAASREILFKARAERRRPHLDDKVITAWNGMVIGAMARGSMILQEPQLLAEAGRTASFLKQHLYDKTSNTLLRRYRERKAGLAGQLTDYVFLVDGLLDLYEASQEPQWLAWAETLTRRQLELFWDDKEGNFFDSVADPDIKVRMRGGYDGAEPAGNSVAARNLLRLAQLQNRPQWQQMARRLMESFSEVINQYPPALPLMLTAWRQIDTEPTHIVIAGERGAEDTEALLRVAATTPSGPRLLLLADGADNQAYLAERLSFVQGAVPLHGRATAYVCSDFTCRMPVTDPQALGQLLKERKAGN
jgi:uncharacterized protein